MSFLLLALLSFMSLAANSKQPAPIGREREVIVLQINIWQEGTIVPGGLDALANEIGRVKADFVMLSEVRNYQNEDFTKKLIAKLKQKGLTYYSFKSYDSGILSLHEIDSSEEIYPLQNDRGSVYKIITHIGKQRVAAYTAHLDYTNYACYLPRGYDGLTWKKLPAPVTDTLKIKEMNLASYRDDAIKSFITDAKKEIEQGALVFLGGDFNEPSALDWTAETKNLYDRHGVVYQWDVSKLLLNAAFLDAYRQAHPSPVTHPGFTYPSDNKDVNISKLTWAPLADERERIDFIYYYPHENLSLQSAEILGPDYSIVRNKREQEQTQDPFIAPLNVWPSDHKAVVSRFLLKD